MHPYENRGLAGDVKPCRAAEVNSVDHCVVLCGVVRLSYCWTRHRSCRLAKALRRSRCRSKMRVLYLNFFSGRKISILLISLKEVVRVRSLVWG